ncbi:hypothetical protein OROGR_027953 [Orobanche gracilis]
MGVSCSCPLALYLDLENGFESIVRSIGLTNVEDPTTTSPPLIRSVSENPEPKLLLHSSGSGKLEGPFVRFRARKTQIMRFIEAHHGGDNRLFMRQDTFGRSPGSSDLVELIPTPTTLYPNSSLKDEAAAIKLQKVYKSFRTRRKLADCAVLIEQSWWKLLDFAELKHSSISFFEIEKHETAISRWSRARTRAAKVGKGLSENGKAQKLALQHWLEAIDPRHRYGHNLHFYYVKWLNSQSKEPFFYWLDIGEGKEVNLVEKCHRSKLQQQCIKYLGPMERKAYEVAVGDGKLIYKETGELLNTTDEPKGCKWIFVLSTSRTLYVGTKKKGSFQHSSFLAGGATLAAGRIVAENGVLKAVWPHSGHYRPTPENFQDFLSFLRDNNVDLTDVKLDSTDDEDSSVGKHARNNSSGDDFVGKDNLEFEENVGWDFKKVIISEKKAEIVKHGLSKLKSLTIPSKDELISDMLRTEHEMAESSTETFLSESQDGEIIPEEHILHRINSHKDMKSFQLGKQLSCKWSTGAGPRIGCVRDYPSGLQSHALEQVNLSPRSKRRLRFEFPSRSSTPTGSNLSRCIGGGNHMQTMD